jgi:hypothetical protein
MEQILAELTLLSKWTAKQYKNRNKFSDSESDEEQETHVSNPTACYIGDQYYVSDEIIYQILIQLPWHQIARLSGLNRAWWRVGI